MTSCRNYCGLRKCENRKPNQRLLKHPNAFQRLHASNTQSGHFKVTNKSAHRSQHVALKDALANEPALRVTFGAPQFQPKCRCFAAPDPPRPPNDSRTRPGGDVCGCLLPSRCPSELASAGSRLHPKLRSGIFYVAGSAMHMRWPNGIGREAGIGRNPKQEGV